MKDTSSIPPTTKGRFFKDEIAFFMALREKVTKKVPAGTDSQDKNAAICKSQNEFIAGLQKIKQELIEVETSYGKKLQAAKDLMHNANAAWSAGEKAAVQAARHKYASQHGAREP